MDQPKNDYIVFKEKNYNEAYGWMYQAILCSKEFPERLSYMGGGHFITEREKQELIVALMPITVYYEDGDILIL